MAKVTSMTYTTEAQFLEAVNRARMAQQTREVAAQEISSAQFANILDQSMAQSTTASRTASTPVPTETLETYFQEAADTYGISKDLLKAIGWHESNYIPDVVSSAGAVGIMQLMPGTAQYLGVENSYDPQQNIMGGAKLLAELRDKYNGNLDLMLAAYNAGTGTVEKYGGVPPFTQGYIDSIKSSMGLQ